MKARRGAKILHVPCELDVGTLIGQILGRKRGDDVVQCAPDLHIIQSVAEEEKPDIIVLDPMALFISEAALEFIQQLVASQQLQGVPLLLWPSTGPETFYEEARRAGVSGYVLLLSPPKDLVAARDVLMAGGKYFPPIKK